MFKKVIECHTERKCTNGHLKLQTLLVVTLPGPINKGGRRKDERKGMGLEVEVENKRKKVKRREPSRTYMRHWTTDTMEGAGRI